MSAIKDDLGNTIRHEKSIADQLNKHFVKVGPNLLNNFPLEPIDSEFNLSKIK